MILVIIFFTILRKRSYIFNTSGYTTITHQNTKHTERDFHNLFIHTRTHYTFIFFFNLPYMLPQFETMIVPFQQYRHWSNLVLLHIQT